MSEDRELDIQGPVIMEGFGPEHTWRADGFELDGDLAWRFEPDLASFYVELIMPMGDGRGLVHDLENGAHIIDEEGAVELAVARDVEPMILGTTAFVPTDEGLAAMRFDGEVCWHLVTHTDENIASLGYDGNLIVATTEADGGGVSVALAIDPETGETAGWRPLHATVDQFGAEVAPVIAGDTAIFESQNGGLVALRTTTGEVAWEYLSEVAATFEGMSIVDSIVVVARRHGGLYGFDLSSGELLWNSTEVLGETGIPVGMAAGDGVVLVLGGSAVAGVDPADGSVLWARDDRLFGTGHRQQPVIGWPVVLGDMMILVDENGQMEAYR